MKKQMIMTAVEETGLSEQNMREIKACMMKSDYRKARELLHAGRQEIVSEIHHREEEVRRIDWLIYNLGKTE